MEAEQSVHHREGTADAPAMDDTADAREDVLEVSAASTIGAHVQDVLRGIMEFIRGREAPEHDHDHER